VAAPAPGRTATKTARPSDEARWSDSFELPQVRVPRSSAAPRPAAARDDPWSRYGWTPPSHATGSAPRFGLWNGLFLWFLLDTLNRPGHAAFFHDNADDPGVHAWRTHAERLADGDAALRSKLAGLDSAVARYSNEPRNPGRLPPDVPVDVARFDGAAQQDAGMGGTWWMVLLLAAALLVFWLVWRRRRQAAAARVPAANAKREKDAVPLFGTLGNYVHQKLSGERYSPSLFRLGMTLTVDPAPFLLGAGATKVVAPEVSGTDRLVGVEAVGTVRAGGVTAYRLYVPGGKGFFQLHLNADNVPDECRYFAVIDEVSPADAGEWAFWLDKKEGMIGWPEFQTKDGNLYQRAWSPGQNRIKPFELAETVETVRGTRTATNQAMLYAAATGATDPAPETEYVLVQVIEQDGQAWVQVAAGIDVNPASLSLA